MLWHTMYSSFNPHTHAGCDCIYNCACGYGYVSIHTPTQGVTVLCPDHVNDLLVSIHTPTQGVTPYWLSLSRSGSFNPHTHAGCDPGCSISPWSSWSFNPHTHAGCDSLSKVYDKRLQVSIHTPTQGVTQEQNTLIWQSPVSIHTPTQGVTLGG